MAGIFTDQNFESEVLKAETKVLVDFWASWCGPCTMMGPIIEELAKDFEGKVKVGKLNVDENPNTAQKYQVMSIPTMILFKNGQEINRQVGFVAKEVLTKLLKNS